MSAGGPSDFVVRLRSRRVERELDAVPGPDYQRILALRPLEDQPRPDGAEKLYDDVYRVRVGDWRIIYLVDDGTRRVETGAVRR